jgi:hypothetical protein
VLYALRHPVSLIGLTLGALIALTVHGLISGALRARAGDRSSLAPGTGWQRMRHYVDPYGLVAVAIFGFGWPLCREVPYLRSGRRRFGALLLVAPVVVALLGLALVAVSVHADTSGLGALYANQFGVLAAAVHGTPMTPSAGLTILAAAGYQMLAIGLFSLLPLPPLPGGRALFALAPQTAPWQRAQYQLQERNIGLGVVFVGLLILPSAPILSFIVEVVAHPLLSLAARL